MKISRYIYIPLMIAITSVIIYSIFGSITGSIVVDFLYGTILGLVLLAYNDFKVRKIDSDEDEDVYNVRPTRKITVFTNYAQAFELCKDSIEVLIRGKIKKVDFEKGIIEASQGMNWQSFGSNVYYKVTRLTDVSTEIELKSTPSVPWTLADWGEGWKSLKNIAEYLDQKNHQMNTAHVLENKSIPTDVYTNILKDKQKKLVK